MPIFSAFTNSLEGASNAFLLYTSKSTEKSYLAGKDYTGSLGAQISEI